MNSVNLTKPREGHVLDENPDLVDLGLGVLDRRKAKIEVFRKGPCGHLVLRELECGTPPARQPYRRTARGRRQVVRQGPGRRYVLPTANDLPPAPAPDAGRHQPVMVAIGEISLSTST